jgi:hypothetical protein
MRESSSGVELICWKPNSSAQWVTFFGIIDYRLSPWFVDAGLAPVFPPWGTAKCFVGTYCFHLEGCGG